MYSRTEVVRYGLFLHNFLVCIQELKLCVMDFFHITFKYVFRNVSCTLWIFLICIQELKLYVSH